MLELLQEALAYLKYYEKQIAIIQGQIATLPQGRIICSASSKKQFSLRQYMNNSLKVISLLQSEVVELLPLISRRQELEEEVAMALQMVAQRGRIEREAGAYGSGEARRQ